jgi:uncharacterized damage-inducible protein DinB
MEPDLRYPIGRFDHQGNFDPAQVSAAVADIAALPQRLGDAIAGLDDAQLDTPYRPDGWTVRQLVHHVADSHSNANIRLRLALTEEGPEIRPYDEKAWAELADSRTLPAAVSLQLLTALHARWSAVLASLDAAAFARTLRHPAIGVLTVAQLTCLYGWHSRHHVAHVTALRERQGW